MKKQTLSVLFALSIAVVLIASLSIVGRIGIAGAEGRAAARTSFDRLLAILSTVESATDVALPELRTKLASFYREEPSILLISVYERGTGVLWRMPASTDYLSETENTRPIPEPKYPPQSTLLLASPLRADHTGRLAVDALYMTLPQITLFGIFRDAALGLASYLALVALAFLISALRDSAAKRQIGSDSPSAEDSRDEGRVQGEGNGDLAHLERDSELYAPVGDEEFDIPDLTESPLSEAEPKAASVEAAAPSRKNAETDTGLYPKASQTEGEEGKETSKAQTSPSGLFSPRSGLGWAEYLDVRLDAELARSASFEQDLSLLFLNFEGLSLDQEGYLALAATVAKFFSFKDLSFEQGEKGFAIILPNIDADHGIRMAEEFLKKYASLFDGQRDRSGRLVVFMGLSSRSGRLVDSQRLRQEAELALRKAKDDKTSNIIAFRPDPDRYRLYLASKGL